MAKRAREDDDEIAAQATNGDKAAEEIADVDMDESDDDGPMPAPAAAEDSDGPNARKRKRKVVRHEKAFLDNLPTADRYYRSFMHRDVLAHALVTPYSNFLLTASVDGHLKFWKKQARSEKEKTSEPGIEFVKHYRAHLTPILALVCSTDGLVAATVAADGSVGESGGQGSVKVFDVENFGMFSFVCHYLSCD